MKKLTLMLLLLTLPALADPTALHAKADTASGVVTAYSKDHSVTLKDKSSKALTFRITDETNVVGKPAPGATVYVIYHTGSDGALCAERVQSPAPTKK